MRIKKALLMVLAAPIMLCCAVASIALSPLIALTVGFVHVCDDPYDP